MLMDVNGVYMEYTWSVHGVYMEYTWSIPMSAFFPCSSPASPGAQADVPSRTASGSTAGSRLGNGRVPLERLEVSENKGTPIAGWCIIGNSIEMDDDWG